MSQSYVNQVTIDCLLNKNVINQYLKKKENKEDIKFYKNFLFLTGLFCHISNLNSCTI